MHFEDVLPYAGRLMCGRGYETYTDEELYFRYLAQRPVEALNLVPTYNLCPTQESPVLRLVAESRRIERMRWQLVPATEPDFTTKLSTINARSESVFSSPLYRDLVVRQRCIVPLSGFYEWKRAGGQKRPFAIHLRNEPIMSVAGVWEAWRPGTPFERRSFSILTTTANDFMRDIHDRMPVILDRSDEDAWLDPKMRPHALSQLLKPCPSSWLNAFPVSTLVNSHKNNVAAMLEPVSAEATADNTSPLLFEM
jgi:putative SOS response-associated peptidase YedK